MPKEKLLILGGTEFVGRQLVETLSGFDQYELYLFNRGQTNPNIFPHANRIIGDRETDDIRKIGQYKWDYIVDFSSYFPASLKRTLEHVNKDVNRYIYISTISVYSLAHHDGLSAIDESFKKKPFEDEQLETPGLQFYGEKKAACEQILKRNSWLKAIILRPAVIYGKYDPTDRLYYWIERIQNKRQLILPDHGDYRMSLTYGPDMVKTIMSGLSGDLKPGTYNCVSDRPYAFRFILETIRDELKSDCEFISIPANLLRNRKLSTREFPLWWGYDVWIDNGHLKNASDLDFSDPEESFRKTAQFYAGLSWPKPKAGFSHEAEDQVLTELGLN
ncbi:MAG: NAD-dependent epimerase/dehydratase family protein [Bacteroidota bacterium]